ncbi:MAG: 2-phospho-L-lactate transferase [Anaerolineales bacterium]|nr:2-phospho-L-lactate transferase [Anaerolineales bacterium]
MKIVALAGGVGGAKLADGLARLSPRPTLTVVVNTGDDFTLFGLNISPDLDTVCYNLASFEDPDSGWGRADESWDTLKEIQRLGGPDWFRLGDRDLATHLERTRRIDAGEPLRSITVDFCQAWGIEVAVLPMSDNPVPTIVQTDQGDLPFQDYFVKNSCEPAVTGFHFQGVEKSKPAPGVLQAIREADFVVVCPSNPWVSIDPILAVPGIRAALEEKVVLAVSPILGGKALKGPAAKMYLEMGITPSVSAIADHYGKLLNGIVIDNQDEGLLIDRVGKGNKSLRVFSTATWMKTREDRLWLAGEVVDFGQQLLKEG